MFIDVKVILDLTQTTHCHAKLKQQKMPKRPIFLALSPPAHSRQKGMIFIGQVIGLKEFIDSYSTVNAMICFY